MIRLKHALRRSMRWVVYLTTFATTLMSAGEQHYAYAWSVHAQEQERIEQVAQALELDPNYVRDPSGTPKATRSARRGARGPGPLASTCRRFCCHKSPELELARGGP